MRLNSLQIPAIKPGEQGPRTFISVFILPHRHPCVLFSQSSTRRTSLKKCREGRWRVSEGGSQLTQIRENPAWAEILTGMKNLFGSNQKEGIFPPYPSNFSVKKTSNSSCRWSEWEAVKREREKKRTFSGGSGLNWGSINITIFPSLSPFKCREHVCQLKKQCTLPICLCSVSAFVPIICLSILHVAL